MSLDERSLYKNFPRESDGEKRKRLENALHSETYSVSLLYEVKGSFPKLVTERWARS